MQKKLWKTVQWAKREGHDSVTEDVHKDMDIFF